MSWSYRVLSSSHRARQFEYRPSSNDENAELLFGTLCGSLYSVKIPSIKNEDEDIYIPRYLGQFGLTRDDAILGICWLRKQRNKYIVGSSKGSIKFGDTRLNTSPNSNIIQEYEKFQKITSVHLNSQDEYILVSGYSKNAMIYDLQSGKIVQEYNDIHTNHINISRFSNRSPNVFATSSFDKCIKLWDLRMKTNTPIYTRECNNAIVMISFSPDDSFLLASGLDNEIQQFRTIDGRSHTTFAIPKTGLEGNFTRAYYSSSGEYIVTGACEESNVSILSSITGEMVGRDQVYPNRKHHSLYIQSLRGSPYSDNSICVLANYREIGDRELILVTIPSPHDDNDDGYIEKVTENSNNNLPPPLNSSLCLPSKGISLEMESVLNTCPKVNYSHESLISAAQHSEGDENINYDLYKFDPDTLNSTGVDILLVSQTSNESQSVALSTHSFALLARSNILQQKIKTVLRYPIPKEDNCYLRVVNVSDITPSECSYLLPLLVKYLYAGDDFISLDGVRKFCLDNVVDKLTDPDMLEIFKLLDHDSFTSLSLWRKPPLCRLLVKTLDHFMALASAWELNRLQALIDNLLTLSLLNTTCVDILRVAEEHGRVAVRAKAINYISSYLDYLPPLKPSLPLSDVDIVVDIASDNGEIEIQDKDEHREILQSCPHLFGNLSPLVLSQVVDIRNNCRVDVVSREQIKPLFKHQMSTEPALDASELETVEELFSLHALKSTYCKPMIVPRFWGHSITKAKNDNLIVTGGRDKLRDYKGSSLHSFNTRSSTWSLLNAGGDSIPSMMLYHVSLPLQKYNSRHIVSIGGSRLPNSFPDDNEVTLGNVVNVLDLMTMTWSAPPVKYKPVFDRKFEIYDRTRHTIVAIYKEDLMKVSGIREYDEDDEDPLWTLADDFNRSANDIGSDILCCTRASSDIVYDTSSDSPQYKESLQRRKQKQLLKLQKVDDTLCLNNSATKDNKNNRTVDTYHILRSNVGLSYVEPVAWFILFGGLCDADESVKNDVHLLTCKARYYKKRDGSGIAASENIPEYEWEWTKPNIKAVRGVPGHRLGHSAACITGTLDKGGNRMIIYGGIGGNEAYGDVLSLRCNDESTMVWENVEIRGDLPGPRYGHTMVCLPESNLLIMFGGKTSFNNSLHAMNDVWVLRVMGSSRDLNVGISLQWEHINFEGVPPTPRFDHRACEVNGNMYILGGMNYTDETNAHSREVFEAESSIHVLDTSIWEWVTPTCSFMGFQEEQLISNSYCTLHTDLMKLLCDAQQGTADESDMAFHCNNGNDDNDDTTDGTKQCTFRAHSILLKARSSFLKMMLEANMKEASSKQVTIYHSEPSVFFSLLIYLYTDTLRINPEDSTLLLEFANQYQITRLQTLIEGFLSQHVSFTNLLDLLELSDLFSVVRVRLPMP